MLHGRPLWQQEKDQNKKKQNSAHDPVGKKKKRQTEKIYPPNIIAAEQYEGNVQGPLSLLLFMFAWEIPMASGRNRNIWNNKHSNHVCILNI